MSNRYHSRWLERWPAEEDSLIDAGPEGRITRGCGVVGDGAYCTRRRSLRYAPPASSVQVFQESALIAQSCLNTARSGRPIGSLSYILGQSCGCSILSE